MSGWLEWLKCFFVRSDERQIFSYWDGVKARRVDPLVVWRAMHAPPVTWAADMRVASNPVKTDGNPFYADDEVCAAEERLLALTRQLFGVKSWSEEQAGLTVSETMELLGLFLRYVGDLKKKHNHSPMPSPASESMVPRPSLDNGDSVTPNGSGCSSTADGSTADALGGLGKQSAPA